MPRMNIIVTEEIKTKIYSIKLKDRTKTVGSIVNSLLEEYLTPEKMHEILSETK